MSNIENNEREGTDIFWYALKVFSAKAVKFSHIIEREAADAEQEGVETFIPKVCDQQVTDQNSDTKVKMRPVMASLLFVRCTENFLKTLKYDYKSDFIYYTRFKEVDDLSAKKKVLQKVPAVIADDEMQVFIHLLKDGGKVTYLGEPQSIKLGDRVRVTSGLLKGREGYVKRIKKDRKFLLVIGNVAVYIVNTIDHTTLERIEDDDKQ